MAVVFKDLSEAGKVHTYLDDIIIPSKSVDDMLEVLESVLRALVGANLTLEPSKCSFGMSTLDYLGFRIAEGVIRPGHKVEALVNFPRPREVPWTRRVSPAFHRKIRRISRTTHATYREGRTIQVAGGAAISFRKTKTRVVFGAGRCYVQSRSQNYRSTHRRELKGTFRNFATRPNATTIKIGLPC